MKHYLLLLALLCWSPFLVQAQIPDSSFSSHNDSTITRRTIRSGKYFREVYTLNGEKLNKRSVVSILKNYPGSADEMKAYSRTGHALSVAWPVVITAFIATCIQLSNQNNSPGNAFDKAPVPITILLGSLVGSGIISLKRDHHLKKAIKSYNNHKENF